MQGLSCSVFEGDSYQQTARVLHTSAFTFDAAMIALSILFQSPSEQQTQALMHEMAKMQEALQALSQVVHESIQLNRSSHGYPETTDGEGQDGGFM